MSDDRTNNELKQKGGTFMLVLIFTDNSGNEVHIENPDAFTIELVSAICSDCALITVTQ